MQLPQCDVNWAVNKHVGDIVRIRRHLHAHPELSWEEFATTQTIKESLLGSTPGLRIVSSSEDCGFICELGTESGPTIGVRADIDALPILEDSGVPYASQTTGVMHACGHDFHTAALIGVIRCLADLDLESRGLGRIRFVFQPAEEAGDGATAMIGRGALSDPALAAMIGFHVNPHAPAGTFGVRPGPIMAACDTLDIDVQGSGGHAAVPELAVDSLLVAAEIVSGLQSVVSRRVPPRESAVLTIGNIAGSSSRWIIPNRIRLEGTFRTLSDGVGDLMREEVRRTAVSIARAHNAEADVQFASITPLIRNDEQCTALLQELVSSLFGEGALQESEIQMLSDDFGFYSQRVKSCYFFTGVAPAGKGENYGLHHPAFVANDEALAPTIALLTHFLTDLLSPEFSHD